jgi:hypothetical protein
MLRLRREERFGYTAEELEARNEEPSWRWTIRYVSKSARIKRLEAELAELRAEYSAERRAHETIAGLYGELFREKRNKELGLGDHDAGEVVDNDHFGAIGDADPYPVPAGSEDVRGAGSNEHA